MKDRYGMSYTGPFSFLSMHCCLSCAHSNPLGSLSFTLETMGGLRRNCLFICFHISFFLKSTTTTRLFCRTRYTYLLRLLHSVDYEMQQQHQAFTGWATNFKVFQKPIDDHRKRSTRVKTDSKFRTYNSYDVIDRPEDCSALQGRPEALSNMRNLADDESSDIDKSILPDNEPEIANRCSSRHFASFVDINCSYPRGRLGRLSSFTLEKLLNRLLVLDNCCKLRGEEIELLLCRKPPL